MKKLTLALIVSIFATASAAYGQAKVGTGSGQPSDLVAASAAGSTRSRVLSTEIKSLASSNHSVDKSVNVDANSRTRPRAGAASTSSTPIPNAVSLNQIYRIGVGDVLDVRLADLPTSKSTLFTVLEGGVLDYPLSNAPITVSGLTTDEVAVQLQTRIKVLDNPRVSVKVRDYSSHSVIVTGSVLDPGARFLRREVTPLYVVLTEAQPRAEAVKATITRSGVPAINIELSNQTDMATLIMPGDMITVLAKPTATYFFAGGALNSPGQKIFHEGLTLTQAIMASGGLTRAAGTKVKVSRQGNDGRLAVTEYNLRQIEDGKTADPVLQEGDRIAVGEGR